MEKSDRNKLGILLTILGGTCWGFSGACGQYLFQSGISPEWLVCIRLLVAGLLIIVFSAVMDNSWKSVLAPFKDKHDRWYLPMYGCIGMAACQITYFKAIEYTNAGTGTVLEYLSPVFLLIGIALIFRQFPEKKKIIACMMAVIGVFLMSVNDDFSGFVINAQGLSWGILAAITYALNSAMPEKMMQKYGTLTVIGWGMLFGALISCIVYQPWNIPAAISEQEVIPFVVVVFIGTIFSYICYMSGVKHIGAAKANILACVEPASATLISIFWLATSFSATDLIGMVLILLSVFMIINNDRSVS